MNTHFKAGGLRLSYLPGLAALLLAGCDGMDPQQPATPEPADTPPEPRVQARPDDALPRAAPADASAAAAAAPRSRAEAPSPGSPGGAESPSAAGSPGGADSPSAAAGSPGDPVSTRPAAGSLDVAAASEGPTARAELAPTENSETHGTVVFTDTGEGLRVFASVAGLEAGRHGLHVHEVGDCSAPGASSAGDHFAPSGDRHGAPSDPEGAHHAGDLGNVLAASGGMAIKEIEDDELTLEGEFGVVGRAVIVHEGEDDLTSQPAGASGRPIACGVVRLDTDSTVSGAPQAGAAQPDADSESSTALRNAAPEATEPTEDTGA
jgi:Cu-Zn family superoxide dismutase